MPVANRLMWSTPSPKAKWLTPIRPPGPPITARYVVVEHSFDNCPYYSLYAHLSVIMVNPGDQVAQNAPLAIMGHTGEGIDRERAHVHLELNLMLNGHFNEWQSKYFPKDINRHVIYNGMNLAGLDSGRF